MNFDRFHYPTFTRWCWMIQSWKKSLMRRWKPLLSREIKTKSPSPSAFPLAPGDRRVRIGYVVETPIWKTSYRLVLGSDPGGAKPAAVPAPAQPGAVAQPQNDAKLQGWAIVENQTDNDWKDVQLSLVSGRPLSFIQDLYHAMYIPRPVVQPDLYASLFPQTYSGGMKIQDLVTGVPDFTDAPNFSLNSTSNNAAKQHIAGGGGGRGGRQQLQQNAFADAGGAIAAKPAMDPTVSIISAASAAKIGELFEYTVGNVSLERQKSAMIPIITDDIDAERISIYNESTLADHPLLGARLKNNTKKYLLQGPITVLDHGSYAGDARVEDLPPGQDRLISYGIDQQVLVDATDRKQDLTLVTGTVLKGALELKMKTVTRQTYVVDNKADDARQIIIEHPRTAGWTLHVPPKIRGTDGGDLSLPNDPWRAHKSFKITVELEVINGQIVELMPAKADDPGDLSEERFHPHSRFCDAAGQGHSDEDRSGHVAAADGQSSASHCRRFDGTGKRIRENMKTVAAGHGLLQTAH